MFKGLWEPIRLHQGTVMCRYNLCLGLRGVPPVNGDAVVGAGRAASWAATVATSFLMSASSLLLSVPSPAALPEVPYLFRQRHCWPQQPPSNAMPC